MALSKSMKQILTGNEAKLEVDLQAMFGGPVEDVALRESIAQQIIDLIIDNAESAKFLNPASAKNQSYSDSYADSEDFKIYGKSKGDVNMTQSGDMLGLLTILNQSSTKLTIGWDDSLQAKKAHGHVTGNVGVKRDFLGLSSGDVEKIKSSVGSVITNNESSLSFLDSLSASLGRSESDNTRTFTAADLFRRIDRGEDIG